MLLQPTVCTYHSFNKIQTDGLLPSRQTVAAARRGAAWVIYCGCFNLLSRKGSCNEVVCLIIGNCVDLHDFLLQFNGVRFGSLMFFFNAKTTAFESIIESGRHFNEFKGLIHRNRKNNAFCAIFRFRYDRRLSSPLLRHDHADDVTGHTADVTGHTADVTGHTADVTVAGPRRWHRNDTNRIQTGTNRIQTGYKQAGGRSWLYKQAGNKYTGQRVPTTAGGSARSEVRTQRQVHHLPNFPSGELLYNTVTGLSTGYVVRVGRAETIGSEPGAAAAGRDTVVSV